MKFAVYYADDQQYEYCDNRNGDYPIGSHPREFMLVQLKPRIRYIEKRNGPHLRAIPLNVLTLRST